MTTPPKPPKTPKPPAKKPATRTPKPEGQAPKARPALTVVPTEGEVAAKAAGLKMKDLIDQVAASTGVKKPEVKKVVEAALARMGTALQAGEALNLTGLGRMRVARAAEAGGAMTLKLRMAGTGGGEKAEKPEADPLADGGDQD